MATTRHTLGQFEGTGALFIGGRTNFKSTGTPVIQLSSTTGVSGPLAQNADIGITRSGTGGYTLTINPFKGPLGGLCYAFTAYSTATTSAGCSAVPTYTGDSLAFALVTHSAGVAVDCDVNFMIFAF